MDVVVRSPEIRDAEPIHSVSMSEGAPTNRGGLELLSDDLIDPATVARNLETMLSGILHGYSCKEGRRRTAIRIPL
jgi:hypothetical protein